MESYVILVHLVNGNRTSRPREFIDYAPRLSFERLFLLVTGSEFLRRNDGRGAPGLSGVL